VHGGLRLGDRPHLRRLRTALERRDSLMFEGVPQYPDWGRFWDIVDKYGVSVLYTAPTAIRAIAREARLREARAVARACASLGRWASPSSRGLALVLQDVVGDGRCPVVDTWWQTETGGILITPLPGATPMKPGSATLPFFGVEPTVVDDQGSARGGLHRQPLHLAALAGIMRTVYGDPDRFRKTYFTTFPGATSPATAADATKMATTGSRPRRRRP